MANNFGPDLDQLLSQRSAANALLPPIRLTSPLGQKSPSARAIAHVRTWGNPEVSRSIPDIRDLMSGIGGKLTVVATWPEQPLVANSGLENVWLEV